MPRKGAKKKEINIGSPLSFLWPRPSFKPNFGNPKVDKIGKA